MITSDPPFYYDVACDRCSAGETRIDAEDFMEAVDQIKKDGWTIQFKDSEYEHICPECSADKTEMFEPQQ